MSRNLHTNMWGLPMIANANRSGAVATSPERKDRQTDVRSGAVRGPSPDAKPEKTESIKGASGYRVRVTDGRLEVVKK